MKYILPILILSILLACSDSPDGVPLQLSEPSVAEIQQSLDNGAYTIEQLMQYYLDRIATIDDAGPMLNAVIAVNPDALEIARSLDAELQDGKRRSPLHGVPVLLKDNIDTQDKMPTTAGSRALADSYPLQDSYIAARLRDAGAVIIGKSNLSEWANFRGEKSSSGSNSDKVNGDGGENSSGLSVR